MSECGIPDNHFLKLKGGNVIADGFSGIFGQNGADSRTHFKQCAESRSGVSIKIFVDGFWTRGFFLSTGFLPGGKLAEIFGRHAGDGKRMNGFKSIELENKIAITHHRLLQSHNKKYLLEVWIF